MSRKKKSHATAAGLIAISLLSNSCNKPSAATMAELKSLRAEVEGLREEKENAAKVGDVKTLKAENDALKAGVRQLDAIKAKADAAEREAAELHKEIDELKRSNAELQKKAISKVRAKAVGETIAVLQCPGGNTYKDVVIRSIDDYGVSFRHEGGSATLRFDTAPEAWVKRFGLEDEAAAKAAATPAPELAATAASATPAETVPADQLNALAQKLMPAVVIIKGNTSEGSGFFAKEGDTTYLYTAAHVICGNTKLEVQSTDGRTYTQFGPMDVAENADMVRLAMLENVPVTATLAQPTDAVIGSPVFAMGDSGGGGVLTVLEGNVKGVGAGELEMDAAIIQGNSGGPVFSAPSGRVLGVVTHLIAARTDVWAAATPFSDVRRFAARVDGQVKWRRVPIGTLINEPHVLAEYNRTTRLLLALAALRPTTAGLRLNATVKEGVSANSIIAENRDVPAVQDLLKMNTALAQTRVRASEKDLLKKFSSYYDTILGDAKRQSATFNPAAFATCNRPQAEACAHWRAVAEKEIGTIIEAMH